MNGGMSLWGFKYRSWTSADQQDIAFLQNGVGRTWKIIKYGGEFLELGEASTLALRFQTLLCHTQ